jgi:LexA-binding, inner membrane-associated putative hydrolase
MYAGHLASAMALKASSPRTPTWALVLGVGLLDVLFGPFVLLGIERVTMTPGISPGFRLDYIDWSHSLLMSLVWSAAFGMLFWRRGATIAVTVAAAVFSHFILDWVVHPGDLALWPGSSTHLGLGLWRTMPNGWWFVELAVIAAFLAYYWRGARQSEDYGGRPWAVAAAILAFHVLNAPWLSPAA